MAFDPTLPADHAGIIAAELRGQFTALADRIAALELVQTRPGAPQNAGLILGAAGSGELGVQCDVPPGATELKIYRVIFGSPPLLLATLSDVTALPQVLTFPPGEEVSFFLTATNAGGESDPCGWGGRHRHRSGVG